MLRIATGFALVAFVGIATTVGLAYQTLNKELKTSSANAVINVASGTGMIGLATQLSDEGVLSSPSLWQWYGRFSGKASQIKAGEYELKPGMSSIDLLNALVNGDVKLHGITVLEGWTTSQLLLAIRANPAIRQTLPSDVGLAALVADLGERLELPYEHGEGLFYPDTYRFARGTTDVQLLLQASELQLRELTEAWQNRAPDPLIETPYDLLKLASIIERETAVDDERAEVSGVFMRRLRRRMRLQTDPTVIYGLGDSFDGNLTRQHLKTDSPYNTYTRSGLPPTPIALPARASLQAAALPAQGSSLYFVALGDGSGRHVFNDTLEEHNKAVRNYLRQLRLR